MLLMLCLCATTLNSTMLAAAESVVHRRGHEPSITGEITRIEWEGVTLQTDGGVRTVRLDLVRSIEFDTPNARWKELQEHSEMLWRARTRLERHDSAMAEPLFERLFEHTRGQSHAVALIVAEGLLRCRLIRGANDLAVLPALETIRLRRSVQSASGIYASLTPILDENTWLCTQLPPIWSKGSDLHAIEGDVSQYDARKDEVVAAIARNYHRAIQQALGHRIEEGVDSRVAIDHPGVTLLRLLVDAGSPSEPQRAAARQSLTAQLDSAPRWMQGWMHVAIGLSLQLEADEVSRRTGMVHLTYLPARYATAQPYLAGVSLAKLIDWCDATGEVAAADTLRQELATRFPLWAATRSTRRPRRIQVLTRNFHE